MALSGAKAASVRLCSNSQHCNPSQPAKVIVRINLSKLCSVRTPRVSEMKFVGAVFVIAALFASTNAVPLALNNAAKVSC